MKPAKLRNNKTKTIVPYIAGFGKEERRVFWEYDVMVTFMTARKLCYKLIRVNDPLYHWGVVCKIPCSHGKYILEKPFGEWGQD